MTNMPNFNDFFKADFFKPFTEFKMPQMPQMPNFSPVDMNSMFTAQRRNLEAATAAGKAVAEGAQAIYQRQAELVRQYTNDFLKASKDGFNPASPDAAVAKITDFTRTSFENSLQNLRELTEMATKSGYEAFDVLNRRSSELFEEVQKTGKKAAGSK